MGQRGKTYYMESDYVRSALAQADETLAHISSIRVAIVEDQRCIADLVVCLCEQHWKLNVVAVAYTGAEGYRAIKQSKPDVVLLDLGLPDGDGVGLAARINTELPAAKIIVVSSLCNDYYLHRLSEVTIKGFLDKFADGLLSLRRAIDHVQRGGTYYSPRYLRATQRLKQSHHAFFKLLTDREQEVLLWISQSLTDEEISDQLEISLYTVRTHRQEIMRKLDIHSTPKLIRLGYELGMSPVTSTLHPVHA